MSSAFDEVAEKHSFPSAEEEVQRYWDKIDAFRESVRRSEGRPIWSFYDGPPFATGLPHYGHILAGTIKDIVCRYAHQTGHYVERRAGWDCHGLPVEYEIDQTLSIKSREDVLAMGIDKYNEECRAIVMRYSTQWVSTVTRMGRWIDFENDYKTMNVSFMESVWWVFKQVWDKGLVYQGYKVMPYSTACTTPLSNFEASQNYKDTTDPAIVVGFSLKGDVDGAMLVAWTTTPWTLPSNLALCVHPEWEYVKVRDAHTGKVLVLLKARLAQLYPPGKVKKAKQPLYKVLGTMVGSDLKGREYEPLFPYFAARAERGCFRVQNDKFVRDDSGTGVVHLAPAFGEEDNRVCREAGIVNKGDGIVCPIDANGRFTHEVADFKGMFIKDADPEIMTMLKASGHLISQDSIVHSYPFCWRSETPLIYRTIPSWFVNVESVKEKLVANNEKTYWVPDFVKTKRFHNWLVEARDWAISRNRFWGTPLPIWMSEDGAEVVVVGSIKELEELSGRSGITDLHRHFIDDITIPSKQGKGVLRRVDEVFDCWFESGAMPYAQVHYPFENKERLDSGAFPADFIAEGLDQTRGWFYTLMVLATCLFDKPAFKNLIVNGLVLAEDGRKMSKRLKNYPDPLYVINVYGADALRLYLINSPVVCGEPLRFFESGVRGIIRDVMLPWYNAFRFFVQATRRLEFDVGCEAGKFRPDIQKAVNSPNIMDRWIIASAHSLIHYVRQEMDAYRLYTTVPRILQFIEQLCNWYIKLNRTRLQRKDEDTSVEDCVCALCALFEVLLLVSKLMAPLTPFHAEYFYLRLAVVLPPEQRADSVHFCMVPDVMEEVRNPVIERAVSAMQPVIELGRQLRDRKRKPLKIPLPELVVIHSDSQFLEDVSSLERYISSELNVRTIRVRNVKEAADSVKLTAMPVHPKLAPRFGGAYKEWQAKIRSLSHEQLCSFLQERNVVVDGESFNAEDIIVQSDFIGLGDRYAAATSERKDLLIVLDAEPDQDMLNEGTKREVVNRVQKMRKEGGLQVQDHIDVFYRVLMPAAPMQDEAGAKAKARGGHKENGTAASSVTLEEAQEFKAVIDSQRTGVAKLISKPFLPMEEKVPSAVVLLSGIREVHGVQLELVITRETPVVVPNAIEAGNELIDTHVQELLAEQEPGRLKANLDANRGTLQVCMNGRELALEVNKHFRLTSATDTGVW